MSTAWTQLLCPSAVEHVYNSIARQKPGVMGRTTISMLFKHFFCVSAKLRLKPRQLGRTSQEVDALVEETCCKAGRGLVFVRHQNVALVGQMKTIGKTQTISVS